MNNFAKFSLVAFTSLILNLKSANADNQYFTRKPGLWEISVNASGRQAPPVKQCIDKNTDQQMQEIGNDLGKNCAKKEMKKSGNDFLVDSECNFHGTTIKSKGVFKGNFTSTYEGEIKSSYNPPILGKSEGVTKVSGKWLGECGEGVQPGDVIMSSGMKINISQMKSLAEKMK